MRAVSTLTLGSKLLSRTAVHSNGTEAGRVGSVHSWRTPRSLLTFLPPWTRGLRSSPSAARPRTGLPPRDELQDIVVYHNPEDSNEPKIRIVPAAKGREIVNAQKAEAMQRRGQKGGRVMVLLIFFVGLIVLLSIDFSKTPPQFQPMVLL